MKLDGRIAVVTGAGAGIGRATAMMFAAEGATVVLVDRYFSDAQETAETIAHECGAAVGEDVGARVWPAEVDVADEAAIEALADQCAERHGRVDVLVNNAGIRAYGPVTEADQASWDAIYAVNLRGAALAAKHVIPLMPAGGTIVNVSSVHAQSGRPGMLQYDTMKAGMLGMTRSLACDHAEAGIRVNAVLPGATLTEFHLKRAAARGAPIDPAVTERPYEGGPGLMKRQARPREIAAAILFLASDEASYITGACLPVDGGISARGSE